jgi:hypothetical protein
LEAGTAVASALRDVGDSLEVDERGVLIMVFPERLEYVLGVGFQAQPVEFQFVLGHFEYQ